MRGFLSHYRYLLGAVVCLGIASFVSYGRPEGRTLFGGTLLVALQILIMLFQTDIYLRQLRIMDKQDRLLAQRPELAMKYSVREEPTRWLIDFIITNSGSGSLKPEEGYYHLLLPMAFPFDLIRWGTGYVSSAAMETKNVDGQTFRHLTKTIPGAVFPETDVVLAECVVPRSQYQSGMAEMLYKFSTHYGWYPPDRTWARLRITIP